MAIKIKIENLTKVFGANAKAILKSLNDGATKEEIYENTGHTVGVHDANLEIREGEIFVIMGLSGSGKSTLLRCLNLLNKPTVGRIWVDGEDIVQYDKKKLLEFRQKKIAMVFQHFGLFTHRTVLENVEYGLEVKRMPKETRRVIAMQMLASVGLEGWEDSYPKQLSGGMQQRVGLARALANNPDILLMDEPFSALDPLIRREMQLELLDIQSKLKKTVVFITHDINEAFKLGDRVAVMKDAKVVQVGAPEEILHSPANDYIAKFVKDIDRTKVLQAKNVMVKPSAIISIKDGPLVALNEMNSNGISSVFAVDAERKLRGIVNIDDTIKAIEEKKSIMDILRKDYHTTSPEIYVQELLPLTASMRYPIAVVDETEKLIGIIVKVSILSALV